MNLHKRRKSLEELAKEINPVLRGIINYYHHFWKDDMRIVWNQLNARLLKWVKWELKKEIFQFTVQKKIIKGNILKLSLARSCK